MTINEKTWHFIREHADDDVRKLALIVEIDLVIEFCMEIV